MANLKEESFGKLSDGRDAKIYTLRNTKFVSATKILRINFF